MPKGLRFRFPVAGVITAELFALIPKHLMTLPIVKIESYVLQ